MEQHLLGILVNHLRNTLHGAILTPALSPKGLVDTSCLMCALTERGWKLLGKITGASAYTPHLLDNSLMLAHGELAQKGKLM